MNAVVAPPLTPLQAAFVHEFVEGPRNAREAALAAGYSEETARCANKQILQHPLIAQAIALEVRRRFVTSAPLALHVVEWLMEHSPSHKVRLDAARIILDRAGHVPPRPIDERGEAEPPLHELSIEQLRALVARAQATHERAESEIANRAKPINATASHPADELIG